MHKSLGAVAGFGVGKGVGNPLGVKVSGLPAWLAHRGYHVMAMPMFERKARIFTGWLNELVWGRDTTAVENLDRPRNAFLEAAGGTPQVGRFESKKALAK